MDPHFRWRHSGSEFYGSMRAVESFQFSLRYVIFSRLARIVSLVYFSESSANPTHRKRHVHFCTLTHEGLKWLKDPSTSPSLTNTEACNHVSMKLQYFWTDFHSQFHPFFIFQKYFIFNFKLMKIEVIPNLPGAALTYQVLSL